MSFVQMLPSFARLHPIAFTCIFVALSLYYGSFRYFIFRFMDLARDKESKSVYNSPHLKWEIVHVMELISDKASLHPGVLENSKSLVRWFARWPKPRYCVTTQNKYWFVLTDSWWTIECLNSIYIGLAWVLYFGFKWWSFPAGAICAFLIKETVFLLGFVSFDRRSRGYYPPMSKNLETDSGKVPEHLFESE